jgi:hypothetical protein
MYTFDYLNAIIPRENDSRENHLMLHYTICMLLVSIGSIRISHARTFATTSQTQLTDRRSIELYGNHLNRQQRRH